MQHQISFKPQWLKAAALMAASRDIRYYLNGVLVEVFASDARLVSTDGHRMVVFRKDGVNSAVSSFIVPTEIIDMVKIDQKTKLEATFSYDPDAPAQVSLEYRGIAIHFRPIDGRYPDYAQTMNKAAKASGENGAFNPDYLADIKRCVQLAFGQNVLYSPALHPNGDGPAGVTYMGRDDFFAMVMPMRMGDSFNPPKWALPPKTEARQEEALAA